MDLLHNDISPEVPLREGDLIIRRRHGGPDKNSSIVGFIARIHRVISDSTFISDAGDKLFLDDFRKATVAERRDYLNAKNKPRFAKDLRGINESITVEDLAKLTPDGNYVITRGTVIVRVRAGSSGKNSPDSNNIGYVTKITALRQNRNGDFRDDKGREAHISSFRLADGSEAHKYIQSGGEVSNINALKDVPKLNPRGSYGGGYNGKGSARISNFTAQAAHSDRELASMLAMKTRMMQDEVERVSLLRQADIPKKRSMHQSPAAVDVMPMKVKAEKKIERTLPPPVVIPIGKKKIKRLI